MKYPIIAPDVFGISISNPAPPATFPLITPATTDVNSRREMLRLNKNNGCGKIYNG